MGRKGGGEAAKHSQAGLDDFRFDAKAPTRESLEDFIEVQL